MSLLGVFVVLQVGKYVIERYLALLNRRYFEDKKNQEEALELLNIGQDDFTKTLKYTRDKVRFGNISSFFSLVVFLLFLVFGGFGWIEKISFAVVERFGLSSILIGLIFFGLMALLSSLSSMPFDYYYTFRIEEKHGFNRQKPKDFFLDRLKGILIAAPLGGACLFAILWIMAEAGTFWWVWAWIAIGFFQMFTLWIFPTVLAPLFNKFTALEEGELRNEIYSLAKKVNFKASGLFLMDASRRSSHGNAYFTGIFGEKRIVLFDTLVKSMGVKEIVAVLAHELGHFKLNHVRWGLLRSVAIMGIVFYLLSLSLPYESFYKAFYLRGISNYGAIFVFFTWFGILDFFISPINSWISRKNEFAADAFALEHTKGSGDLATALLKLRESNHAMPLSHPLYSMVYHSHPPLMERLKELNYKKP